VENCMLVTTIVSLALSSVVSADITTVTITGNGTLLDFDVSGLSATDVGSSLMSFSYDDTHFTLTSSSVLPTRTDRTFSTPDRIITVIGGGVSYSVSPFNGASMVRQPGDWDQFSYMRGGGVLMQWNDRTNSSFTDPLPFNFPTVNTLVIDQITNNPNMLLTNNSVTLLGLNGNDDLQLRIEKENHNDPISL
jgi:hypothetical protein